MNIRLQQFLNAENLSQSQFADKIGVARASISHIMAGRNKPGFDFILNMARSFPALNLDWLITGKGKMYKQAEATLKLNSSIEKSYTEESIFDDDSIELSDSKATYTDPQDKPSSAPARVRSNPQVLPESRNNDTGTRMDTVTRIEPNKRNITRIVVFYDDNTFQEAVLK